MIPTEIKKIYRQTIKYDDVDKITLQCRERINETTNISEALEEQRTELVECALNYIEPGETYNIKFYSRYDERVFFADDEIMSILEIKPVPRMEIEEVKE